MDILTTTDLLETINEVIRTLEADESVFYIALDVAHQLRDEVQQALAECSED